MKKFLSLALVAMLAFVACETKPSTDGLQEVSGTMTITSSSPIEVNYLGGQCKIDFQLEGHKEGDEPTVECAQEWITDINVDESITFNVARNTTEEERTAILLITYGEQEEQVFVKQDAAYSYPTADVEFVAKTLNGEYFGRVFSPHPNYFIVLSENGTTGFSDMYIDTYYRLDIYSDVDNEGDVVTLPQGVYKFDPLSMGYAPTFGDEYSVRLQPMADGNLTEEHFIDGVIEVTENRIEAFLTLDGGKVHHVVYEGSLELKWVEIPEPDYYTYLTEDYTFNHDLGVMRMTYYGDYYNTGGTNWTISVMESLEPINGDYFMFDIVTPNMGQQFSDICGEYTCVASDAEAANGTFIAGGMEGRNMTFSWYRVVEDNYINQTSGGPMVGGKIKIEQDGSNYVLTVDCVDDLGHKVQGTFSCSILEFYDGLAQ